MPVLIRLSDIAEIRTGSERKIATTHGGSSKTHHYFTLYSIGFYRKDRFERGWRGTTPGQRHGLLPGGATE